MVGLTRVNSVRVNSINSGLTHSTVRDSNNTKHLWRLWLLNLAWFLFAGLWQLTAKWPFRFLVLLPKCACFAFRLKNQCFAFYACALMLWDDRTSDAFYAFGQHEYFLFFLIEPSASVSSSSHARYNGAAWESWLVWVLLILNLLILCWFVLYNVN